MNIDTPPGNFKMLSRLNELDPTKTLLKIQTSPASLAVIAFESCQEECQYSLVVSVRDGVQFPNFFKLLQIAPNHSKRLQMAPNGL